MTAISAVQQAIDHGFVADNRGRRFWFPGAHLSDTHVVEGVNRLIIAARSAGETTWFDREITEHQARAAFREWALEDDGVYALNEPGGTWPRVTENTPGAIPVTILEL